MCLGLSILLRTVGVQVNCLACQVICCLASTSIGLVDVKWSKQTVSRSFAFSLPLTLVWQAFTGREVHMG